MASTSSRYAKAAEVAKAMQITARQLRNLANDGIVPPSKNGQYDLMACVASYIKHLQKRAAGRQPSKESADAHGNLKRLQARKLELDLAERERTLIEIEEVDVLLQELLLLFRWGATGLRGRLTYRISSEVGSLPAAVSSWIKQETDAVLNECADKLASSKLDLTEEDFPDLDAA